MKIKITAILIIWSQCLFSQVDFEYNPNLISNETKKIVKVFLNADQVEGKHIYYGGMQSKVYSSYEGLMNTANNTELIELTSHPNPIARYYAFDALLEKQVSTDTLFKILKIHLKDTISVSTQFGCIGGRTSIGDYMFSSLKYSDSYEFSEQQKNEIDSLLFWNDSNLIEARNQVLRKLEKSPKNYLRLKQILVGEKNPLVLLPVLSYQNEEDNKFIKEFISISPITAFKGIRLYPQKGLNEKLKEFQNKKPDDFSNQTWIALYEAALAYSNDIALDVFLNVFLESKNLDQKEKHAKFVYWTIKDNFSQFLLPVKIEISAYLSNMTIPYFNLLWKTDSIKTFEFIQEKFKKESHPYYDEELINEIIDKVEILRGDSAITFINQGISKGYSSTYFTLALRARKYNNQTTIEILIDRFNNEFGNNEQDIYYRSKGILNYNNEEVYERIEDKVFQFLQNSEIGNFAGKNIVELALKCNKERGIETLLSYITENYKSSDLLRISVSKLIELNESQVNNRLVEIYDLSSNDYKDSFFGKIFSRILVNNNLK
ncbi:MAG: hypothetical protein AB8B72_08570 [Crocinitomicaceae bacterium]